MYRSRKVTKQYNPDKKRQEHSAGGVACPFCVLRGNNIIVHDGETMRVVKNLFGYKLWELMDVKEHLMIVPKRHVESISEFTKQEKDEMIELLAEYEKKGYNIYARESGNAIKSVPHQHTHLIKTHRKRAKFFIFSHKPYFIWKV